MQAVILAAGQGVRLRPLTVDRPKPLVVVAGKPLIKHVIEALPDEIDEIVVVVGYLGEQVREYLGKEMLGRAVEYVQQGEIHSTGGALLSARGVVRGRFLVMPADDIHGPEALRRLVTHDHALLAARSQHPERFGVLALNQDGTLASIEEKPTHPQTNLVNTSVMVLSERVFDYVQTCVAGDHLHLTDMVTRLAADVPIAVEVQNQWYPVGYPEDIAVIESKVGGDHVG